MNCHDVRSQLDRSDGEIDSDLPAEVRTHLAGCAECRRVRDRLAALRDPRAALQSEIQPARDLWPAIERRLDEGDVLEESAASKIRWLPKLVPLAAAAALAAVAVAILVSRPPERESTVATRPQPRAEIASVTGLAQHPAESVEIGFAKNRTALLKLVEVQKRAMTPEQVAAVEQTLGAMNSAIRDIRAALDRDPYNRFLLLKLSDTRRSELRYLERVIS